MASNRSVPRPHHRAYATLRAERLVGHRKVTPVVGFMLVEILKFISIPFILWFFWKVAFEDSTQEVKNFSILFLLASGALVLEIFIYFNASEPIAFFTSIPLSLIFLGSIAEMFREYKNRNMIVGSVDLERFTTKPRFKVGQVVRAINPSKCKTFSDLPNASKIRIVAVHKNFYKYQILDKNDKIIGHCEGCFGDNDLIPYEN